MNLVTGFYRTCRSRKSSVEASETYPQSYLQSDLLNQLGLMDDKYLF